VRLNSARMRHGARTFVTRPERTLVIVDLRYIFIPQTLRKILEKIRTERSRQASRRIYQSGRDNLFQRPLSKRWTALRWLRPPIFWDCAMVVIVLLTIGLLGDGFMLYVLLQWMHDGARNRD